MNPPTFLTSSLYVALGGGTGAWLRYLTGRLVGPATTFPWATLTVNVVGSFAMGVLAGGSRGTARAAKAGGCCWASAFSAVSPHFPRSVWNSAFSSSVARWELRRPMRWFR
jgi:hypothetical protein